MRASTIARVGLLALALSPSAATAQEVVYDPVADSNAGIEIAKFVEEIQQLIQLYEQYEQYRHDFNAYVTTFENELNPAQNLGYYIGHYKGYWRATAARNAFGRVQQFFDAENDGLAGHVRYGYEGVTAWMMAPAGETSNQDAFEDTSAMVNAIDSQAQDALKAVGIYRKEQIGELDNMLGTLQYELTDGDQQSEKAILQHTFTADVLLNMQAKQTNRLLAEIAMLEALQLMVTRNGLAYGVNANLDAAHHLDSHLGFMDDAHPNLSVLE